MTLDYNRIYNNMTKPAFLFDGRKILDHERLIKYDHVYYQRYSLANITSAESVFMWRRSERGYTGKISRGSGTKTEDFIFYYNYIIYILVFILTILANKRVS